MRILFTVDWHLSGAKPSSRVDIDFIETQVRKVTEVFNIANELKVDMIIHGGDITDKARTPYLIINKIIPLFKENKIPFEAVIGSHDTVGYNLESLDYTGLGNLIKSGYIKILDQVDMEGFHCKVISKVPEGYENKILVMHDMVSPEPLPFSYISLEEIASKNKNVIVLSGHLHKQFKKVVNGCLFVNPGPLVRTDISEINIKPSVAIIDTETREVKFIELTSALPGNKVFAIEKVQELKSRELAFQCFVESLGQRFCNINIEEVLLNIANEKKIDPVVVEKCLVLLRSQ